MAAAGLPHDRRDGRPRRAARHRARPSTTGRPRASTSRRSCAVPQNPYEPDAATSRCAQDHGLDKALDQQLIASWRAGARATASRCTLELPIRNVNRTVGTMLGHEVTKALRRRRACPTAPSTSLQRLGRPELRRVRAQGITLRLEGDANDYVGKGLSGGRDRRAPRPRRDVRRRGQHHRRQRHPLRRHQRRGLPPRHRRRAVLRAQLRRHAVVEGVGDHGCEYMTGGRVVVLGPTGRNFARRHVRRHRLRLRPRRHVRRAGSTPRWSSSSRSTTRTASCCARRSSSATVEHTGSAVAERDPRPTGTTRRPTFVKVMPRDYKRVLAGDRSEAERSGLDEASTLDGDGGVPWVSRPAS